MLHKITSKLGNILSFAKDNEINRVTGYINIKQRKVHKAIVISMIDYVPDILAKYNYGQPKVPSYKFNERLKELGKMAKLKQHVEIVRKKGVNRVTENSQKWELMSLHICRRSFCTNMYHADPFIHFSHIRTYPHVQNSTSPRKLLQ